MKSNNTAPKGAQDNCGATAQPNASAHPIETPAGKQVADSSDSPERRDLGAATCSASVVKPLAPVPYIENIKTHYDYFQHEVTLEMWRHYQALKACHAILDSAPQDKDIKWYNSVYKTLGRLPQDN